MMEITAIPPTTPPAMTPAFGLCPPTGIGVAVFEVVEPDTDPVAETEAPEGPSMSPGSSSGVTIKVRRGCEPVTGVKIQRREFPPPAIYDLVKFQ
jgi:hypothetical protein